MFDFTTVTNWLHELLLSVMPAWLTTTVECILVAVFLLLAYSVLAMMALAPDMEYGLLSDSWIVDFAGYAKNPGCQYVHPIFCEVTDLFALETARAGIGVNTWTVNEEKDIRDMIAKGCHAVIGNYPDRVKKILDEQK